MANTAEVLQQVRVPNRAQDWNYIRSRTAFLQRDIVVEMAVRLSYQVPGNIIEFGVADGTSTRVIRRIASQCETKYPTEAKKRIYACDSFEGLREKFENAEVGTFKTEPPRIRGVNIVKGYFEESLTNELRRSVGPVAFASLDADLYSSTLCALNWLTPLLGTGSLLLFDEFVGEKESEKRAFERWSAETGTETVMIADFIRDPSGWGEKPDRRVLFQVVGKETLHRHEKVPGLKQRVDQELSKYPHVRKAVRSVYRYVK